MFISASNQNEDGKAVCGDCDGAFSQVLQNNHKAITEATFEQISNEREQLKVKTDRIEVLTSRVDTLLNKMMCVFHNKIA